MINTFTAKQKNQVKGTLRYLCLQAQNVRSA